jgi:hypothetical protein
LTNLTGFSRNDVVSFPITPLFFEYENEGGLTGAERGCINWLNDRFEKSLVGVLFMELITSYEVKGLRRVFLKKLRQLCNDHKVLIVVDNSMTSIRCGYFFDFLFYDQVCNLMILLKVIVPSLNDLFNRISFLISFLLESTGVIAICFTYVVS